MPLNNDIYLAPIIPVEILKITGNGKPYFCEGLEIKFANKHTKNAANKELQRTMRTIYVKAQHRRKLSPKALPDLF